MRTSATATARCPRSRLLANRRASEFVALYHCDRVARESCTAPPGSKAASRAAWLGKTRSAVGVNHTVSLGSHRGQCEQSRTKKPLLDRAGGQLRERTPVRQARRWGHAGLDLARVRIASEEVEGASAGQHEERVDGGVREHLDRGGELSFGAVTGDYVVAEP